MIQIDIFQEDVQKEISKWNCSVPPWKCKWKPQWDRYLLPHSFHRGCNQKMRSKPWQMWELEHLSFLVVTRNLTARVKSWQVPKVNTRQMDSHQVHRKQAPMLISQCSQQQELELSGFACDLFSRGAVAGDCGPGETGGKQWTIYSGQDYPSLGTLLSWLECFPVVQVQGNWVIRALSHEGVGAAHSFDEDGLLQNKPVVYGWPFLSIPFLILSVLWCSKIDFTQVK